MDICNTDPEKEMLTFFFQHIAIEIQNVMKTRMKLHKLIKILVKFGINTNCININCSAEVEEYKTQTNSALSGGILIGEILVNKECNGKKIINK